MIVADSGMLNATNCQQITQTGYDFILGGRLKNLPQQVKKQLLNKENYQELIVENPQNENERLLISYQSILYQGQKLVCTYSSKRAKKDKAKRDERIAKATQLLRNPALVEKKAKFYFLKKQGNNNYEIDSQKIEQAACYDGLKVLICSNPTISEEIILTQYKQLYKIEQSFRTFKSFLETRPMFHWTDERIKGHFALCYLSFALLRYWQYQLKMAGLPHSEQKIRQELHGLQVSHLQQNKQDFYLRSHINNDAEQLLKNLQISKLPDITAKPLITKYLA
jgi:transposase